MDFLLDALTDWLKEMLVGGIMSNLSGMFDSVNQQVADIATQVGQTPQGWNGSIFSMIQNLSNSIMVPIAGVILAIVMTLELIQMITDKNNLHDVDTWMIFKWVFKSAAAILIVSNTWNIVMGVFDAAQSVVAQAAGIIGSDASIDISSVMTDMESRLMDMDLGPLFGLWFQSLFIGITMWALYICIFIVIYGRMIEIYLVTSVAPIPMATMMGKEWGGMATIGLSKPYYAIYAEAGGVVSYSDGAVMGKATEANISIETTEDNNLYGDNGLAETDRRFANGTLTLSTTDLSQEVSKAILGLTEQAITGIDGVTDTSVKELVYDDAQVTPYLGVGFIIKKKVNGVYKWRGVVLPKIMFSVPEDAATTQGESIEWQTPELTGAIMRDDSATHVWKKEATFTTEAQAEAYIKARLGITA